MATAVPKTGKDLEAIRKSVERTSARPGVCVHTVPWTSACVACGRGYPSPVDLATKRVIWSWVLALFEGGFLAGMGVVFIGREWTVSAVLIPLGLAAAVVGGVSIHFERGVRKE